MSKGSDFNLVAEYKVLILAPAGLKSTSFIQMHRHLDLLVSLSADCTLRRLLFRLLSLDPILNGFQSNWKR